MKISDLIEDLEAIAEKYSNDYDINMTSDWFIMKMTEELGELTQSYLKCMGQARRGAADMERLRENLEDELADLIGMALLFGNDRGIDIEKAFERKWLKYLDSPKAIVNDPL